MYLRGRQKDGRAVVYSPSVARAEMAGLEAAAGNLIQTSYGGGRSQPLHPLLPFRVHIGRKPGFELNTGILMWNVEMLIARPKALAL